MPTRPLSARYLLCSMAGSLLLLGLVSPVNATTESAPPSVAGMTFTGSGTEQCLLESPEPFDIKVSFTSQKQISANEIAFEGVAQGASPDDLDSLDEFTDFDGSVFSGGSVSGSFKTDDGNSGNFDGTLVGGTLSISYNTLAGPDAGCSGSFTASKATIGSLSAGSSRTGEALVSIGTRQLISQLNARQASVQQALRGLKVSQSGVTPIAGGLMFEHASGQNAGDDFGYPWGLWGAVQYSDFEDDFAATAFDAERYSMLVGADFSPWDNFVGGVAVGYESSDVDTTFNRGEQDIDGFTIAPYVGALLPTFGLSWDVGVDFSIGYSSLDIDQFRTAGGARVTSSVDVDRLFASSHLNASKNFGALLVSGRVGFIVARDEHGAFTESDGTPVAEQKFEFGQFRIGGDLAYSSGDWEPYASATYQNDYSREKVVVAGASQPSNDDDDVQLGLGVRWFGGENMSASFEYSTILGREDYDENTFNLLLRAEF